MNYKIPEEDIEGNIKKAIENKEQGPNTNYLITNWLVLKQQFRPVLNEKLNKLISLTQHMATTMGVLRAHNDGTISQRPQNIIIALKSAEEDAAEYAVLKARALAKRNYKWMPNPFSNKPGALGVEPGAEAKYFENGNP